jgi:hypothetical protein
MQLTICITSNRDTLLIERPVFFKGMQKLKAMIIDGLNLKEEPIFITGYNGYIGNANAKIRLEVDIRIIRSQATTIEEDLANFSGLNPNIARLKEQDLPAFLQKEFRLHWHQVSVNIAQFKS